MPPSLLQAGIALVRELTRASCLDSVDEVVRECKTLVAAHESPAKSAAAAPAPLAVVTAKEIKRLLASDDVAALQTASTSDAERDAAAPSECSACGDSACGEAYSQPATTSCTITSTVVAKCSHAERTLLNGTSLYQYDLFTSENITEARHKAHRTAIIHLPDESLYPYCHFTTENITKARRKSHRTTVTYNTRTSTSSTSADAKDIHHGYRAYVCTTC
ncbi:hypothetical protein AB1Y20_006589 [Prymnesium parvum]|uniref:Uncharacterized protein n=1 Tax=Prymnesium parvum TaxID=97485 RepID=A0AB34IYI6_PRYPA